LRGCIRFIVVRARRESERPTEIDTESSSSHDLCASGSVSFRC
jgi:hypothetical protein